MLLLTLPDTPHSHWVVTFQCKNQQIYFHSINNNIIYIYIYMIHWTIYTVWHHNYHIHEIPPASQEPKELIHDPPEAFVEACWNHLELCLLCRKCSNRIQADPRVECDLSAPRIQRHCVQAPGHTNLHVGRRPVPWKVWKLQVLHKLSSQTNQIQPFHRIQMAYRVLLHCQSGVASCVARLPWT